MTDLCFPNAAPNVIELCLIMLKRYTPELKPNGEFFNVLIYSRDTREMAVNPITVPTNYHSHLCRFLWCHQAYMEIQTRLEHVQLPLDLLSLLQRYTLYMDGIMEGLLTTVWKHKGDASYRSRLFDLYLVLEYNIGCHEFNIVDAWKMEHRKIILECQDIHDIGK